MPTKNSALPGLSAKNRPSRIYTEGRMWYFSTREQTVEGPFYTAVQAEEHLDDYLLMVCSGSVPPGVLDLIER